MSATITLYPDGDNWRWRIQVPDAVTGLTVEVRSGSAYADKELARIDAETAAQDALDAAANTERYDYPPETPVPDEPPTS